MSEGEGWQVCYLALGSAGGLIHPKWEVVSSYVQEYKAGWFSQIHDPGTPPFCSSQVMSVQRYGLT